jgi:hypothetical protein
VVIGNDSVPNQRRARHAGSGMVLVPAESVPRGLSATAIGLVTLIGELIGATASPAMAGSLAATYGLGACLWLSAAGTFVVFVSSLFLKETLGEPKHSEETTLKRSVMVEKI